MNDIIQTKGEYRVGTSFNPSADSAVDRVKTAAAALIDLLDELVPQKGAVTSEEITQQGERMRLKALAQTHIEDGAMWAVKSITKPVPTYGGPKERLA